MTIYPYLLPYPSFDWHLQVLTFRSVSVVLAQPHGHNKEVRENGSETYVLLPAFAVKKKQRDVLWKSQKVSSVTPSNQKLWQCAEICSVTYRNWMFRKVSHLAAHLQHVSKFLKNKMSTTTLAKRLLASPAQISSRQCSGHSAGRYLTRTSPVSRRFGDWKPKKIMMC